jgi:PAS domain S-box-containing protein
MDDDLRILVLGDGASPEDFIDFELCKSNQRFKTLRVTSQDRFLHALQASSPNLILITTGCPGISSLTALALAQEMCPQTPCFLISPTTGQTKAAARQADRIDQASREVQGMGLKPAITAFFRALGHTALVWADKKAVLKTKFALKPLMQVAGVIIVFLSPKGRILEINRGAEHLTGWHRHEILGTDGIDLFFPEANRISAVVHLRRVLSGKSAEKIDLPLQLRDGSKSVCRWYCNRVSDELGHPAGIMLVGQPLSDLNPVESQPRGPLARSLSPGRSKGRGLLSRRTGSC